MSLITRSVKLLPIELKPIAKIYPKIDEIALNGYWDKFEQFVFKGDKYTLANENGKIALFLFLESAHISNLTQLTKNKKILFKLLSVWDDVSKLKNKKGESILLHIVRLHTPCIFEEFLKKYAMKFSLESFHLLEKTLIPKANQKILSDYLFQRIEQEAQCKTKQVTQPRDLKK